MRGHTISDLFINRGATDYVGLFGVVHTAGGGVSIKDGTLADVDITGDDRVGALIGYIYGGVATDVTDVIVSGSISGDDYVGGLIGEDYTTANLTISGCDSSGTVTSIGNWVGGLLGATYESAISRCLSSATVTGVGLSTGGLIGRFWGAGTLAESYATGNVSAPAGTYVGGLIGRAREVGSIADCYARGAVTGDDLVGGFVGELGNGSIANSFSTGLVTGNTNVGGFCGLNGDTITDCFWDIQTSGQAASDGGTGKTTSEMKTRYTFTVAGWDFIIIWGINGVTNDGYPFHWATTPPEDLPDAPRETVLVEDKITLESIRNVEMAAMGRFSINEEGKAAYKSRYARNP